MAKKIDLEQICKIAVSRLQSDGAGDFYDLANQDQLGDEFYFGIGPTGKVSIFYHERIGSRFFSDSTIEDVVEKIGESGQAHLPIAMLGPMITTGFTRDASVLADAFDQSEFSFYDVKPSECVEKYKSTVDDLFSLCAITEIVRPHEAYSNGISDQIVIDGEECENLGWAFAELLEEDSRVFIVRPTVYAAENVIPLPTASSRMRNRKIS